MSVLDFILNCVGLIVWLNWRSQGLSGPGQASGIALISTLRRAENHRRSPWTVPLILVAGLLLRAIFYWQIGPALGWLPRLPLGAIVLHFRSDMFTRMFVFSLLSFLLFLAVFYFSLLLLAGLSRPSGPAAPWSAWVRAHLGPAARLPGWLLLLLPPAVTFCAWILLGPLLGWMQVQAGAVSLRHLVEQAVVIGLASWLCWQFFVIAVLVLHVVSSYVYLGNAPFWNLITLTAQSLLRPLAWLPLRAGRIDFAPVFALAVVVLAAVFVPSLLVWLYARLPL